MNAIEKSALSRLDEFVTSRDKFQLVMSLVLLFTDYTFAPIHPLKKVVSF